MYAKYPKKEIIRKGIMVCLLEIVADSQFLLERQQENGEWLQESIEGVFNKNWYLLPCHC